MAVVIFALRVVLARWWRDKSHKRFRHLFTNSISIISSFFFFFCSIRKRTRLERSFVISPSSSTNLQTTQDVCCYALRYGGPERGLQTSSGSTGRLCLQVLPASFHQGTQTSSPLFAIEFINESNELWYLGLQLDDPRAQSPRRRHLHVRSVRQDLQAPGQLETAQVT